MSARGRGTFAEITSESKEGKIQAGVEDVMFHLFGGEGPGDFGVRGGQEGIHGGGVTRSAAYAFLSEPGPVMEAFPERQEMPGGIAGIPKVCEKQPGRRAFQDGCERSIPDDQIDVRRRSRGHHVGVTLDTNAGGVTNEGDAFLVVEIAHMVRRVARSVDNFKLARAERQRLAAFKDAEILGGDREGLTKEMLQ